MELNAFKNPAPRYVFSEVFDLKPTRTGASRGFEQEVDGGGTEGESTRRSSRRPAVVGVAICYRRLNHKRFSQTAPIPA